MTWFWFALIFAIWSSLSLPIVKKVTKTVNPVVFLFLSNLFIIPVMFVAILIMGGFPNITPLFLLFIAIAGVLDAVAFAASFWAIKLSPISLISPISAFNPVFVMVFALIGLSEVPTPQKLIGVCIVVIGAYILNISDTKVGFIAPFKKLFSDRGVQLFLLTNFLWGITPIFQKQAIMQTSPTMPLAASFMGIVFATLFVCPFILLRHSRAVIPSIKPNLGWLVLMAPFSVLAQFAAYQAFALTNVGYATAAFKLSILFTILLGGFVFKEDRLWERLLGAFVMVLGTLLIVL